MSFAGRRRCLAATVALLVAILAASSDCHAAAAAAAAGAAYPSASKLKSRLSHDSPPSTNKYDRLRTTTRRTAARGRTTNVAARAKNRSPKFPESSTATVDNARFVMYHANAQTCYLHDVDTSSIHLNAAGPYVSLGAPVEALGGVQVFASTSYSVALRPALMLYIPAKANPLGNFDRWAIFPTLARAKMHLGKAAHEQLLETTAASNGTRWRVTMDLGTQQRIHKDGAIAEHQARKARFDKVVLPSGPPHCVTGHDVDVDVMGEFGVQGRRQANHSSSAPMSLRTALAGDAHCF